MIATIFGLTFLVAGILALLGLWFVMENADFQATEMARLTEELPPARPTTHLYLDEVLPDRVPCVGPWDLAPSWTVDSTELALFVGGLEVSRG